MKAAKLFEKLGYRKNKSVCYNNRHILYEKPVVDDTDIFTVEFKDGKVLFTSCLNGPIWMDVELVKAIHKQLAEMESRNER